MRQDGSAPTPTRAATGAGTSPCASQESGQKYTQSGLWDRIEWGTGLTNYSICQYKSGFNSIITFLFNLTATYKYA
ncbi:MAG: hypothetical protein O8C64_15410, partial [Candidatus Methanoperedens sp.]|nr:hypothetical protein [Candidatus Methanoperedens sp.]MCZ7405212.1 hypothetical protein [Candidatus Methanoperedens sp.]